ncbi:NADH-ubiquinone oxidoreductase kda subunit [Stagonosporopsis vannaccii]|nr:NADH-ubiquinone oxidoreductase kda subunit [Stagonosporopsis vannaccii]
MVINPTYLAQRTRSCTDYTRGSHWKEWSANDDTAISWTDAKKRVIHSYRDWLRSAPEIQTMYSLNMPVSTLRTKIRQEFERHRYVNQIKTVDVLLFNSHQEFQETLNYWKQLSHVLKYFRAEEDPKARLPANFINGFLEGRN